MILRTLVPATLALLLGACARESVPPVGPDLVPAANVAVGSAYSLFVGAAGCWMGGLWADARGEAGDARLAAIHGRCASVMTRAAIADDRYDALRAIEPHEVDAIARAIEAAAARDPADAPNATELVALFRRAADALRETTRARRAADAVKEDAAGAEAPPSYADDKRRAATAIGDARALGSLLRFDGRAYGPEARTIALLVAVDRLEIARGLPKHLKIVALADAFDDLFGVRRPALPSDPASAIPAGTWLAYLTEVAAAAGHAVPADVVDPKAREPRAWTGVLAGFADKLRVVATELPDDSELSNTALRVIGRLDAARSAR